MRQILIFCLLLVLTGCVFTKEKKAYMYGDQLGNTQLPLVCSEKAGPFVERGLALLHHMTYDGARASFEAASQIDSSCAVSDWGQAMTYIHPLWSDPPSLADFNKAENLLTRARIKAGNNKHALAYITAAQAYFTPGWNQNEKTNLASFAKAWEKVYRQFPDDMEAASFYALAHMATAKPTDKTYTVQKQAAAIAEKVLIRIPDHPGGHHYVIHAYDYPALAEKALTVARSYGNIAPAIPHALHMPTHIFTRLGLWQESIEMNKRSADAALKHPAGKKLSLHYLHALDYMTYAYLQRADDDKAQEVLSVVENLQGPFQTHVASAYTLAAVPARITLERRKWKEAVSLMPQTPASYPWEKNPAMEAITYFARALGAAHTGDADLSNTSLQKLITLRDKAQRNSAYWGKQVEIMRLAAKAWFLYKTGYQEKGLAVGRNAAILEAGTEKHPVTPAEVLPARELFADMLFVSGDYKNALTEYEKTLERHPNRFNSLLGAFRSAEKRNDKEKAGLYYEKLRKVSVDLQHLSLRLNENIEIADTK